MIDPDGIDVPELLGRWYGPPSAPEWTVPAEASWLPAPLREWYGLESRWTRLQSGGTRVYRPAQVRADGGEAVFMEDPTGDWTWSFDVGQPDRVHEGEPGGDRSPVPEALPEFLVHLALAQLVVTADFGRLCAQLPADLLPGVLTSLEEVGFAGWRWPRPGHRIFLGDSAIANVGPAIDPRAPWRNREGHVAVRIAGIGPSDLDHLDAVPSVKWIDFGFGT
ncbi:hypothetical protein [Saccharothrix hoggarensis]|uniref:Uncharacterized protein n=1 Tax=Saccharothrix hoggarensis TaxID=913853 RepID=A0ABW3QZ36_9PSEU